MGKLIAEQAVKNMIASGSYINSARVNVMCSALLSSETVPPQGDGRNRRAQEQWSPTSS